MYHNNGLKTRGVKKEGNNGMVQEQNRGLI